MQNNGKIIEIQENQKSTVKGKRRIVFLYQSYRKFNKDTDKFTNHIFQSFASVINEPIWSINLSIQSAMLHVPVNTKIL